MGGEQREREQAVPRLADLLFWQPFFFFSQNILLSRWHQFHTSVCVVSAIGVNNRDARSLSHCFRAPSCLDNPIYRTLCSSIFDPLLLPFQPLFILFVCPRKRPDKVRKLPIPTRERPEDLSFPERLIRTLTLFLFRCIHLARASIIFTCSYLVPMNVGRPWANTPSRAFS